MPLVVGHTKFLGCDSTDMVTLVDGMLASEYPTAKPSNAVYPQRNLNLECWFALAFLIHLKKENDDFALNDIIDARSQINPPSLSNAPPSCL